MSTIKKASYSLLLALFITDLAIYLYPYPTLTQHYQANELLIHSHSTQRFEHVKSQDNYLHIQNSTPVFLKTSLQNLKVPIDTNLADVYISELQLSNVEKLFHKKLFVNDKLKTIYACRTYNQQPANLELDKYQCEILKAHWLNHQRLPDEAMEQLLQARIYFQANEIKIAPETKAWMFQVLSETRSQLGEHQQALIFQKKAVHLFKIAIDVDKTLLPTLVSSLKILSQRFIAMDKPANANIILDEAKRYMSTTTDR